MNAPLRILHLEDNPHEAELCHQLLEREGLHCDITRAGNAAEFHAGLATGRYDAILCDYTLPDYDGMRALAHVREVCPDVPFLFVSGELGEEAAIAAMKQGATDYVLKMRLSRLAPAVGRAVAEAAERREHLRAEQAVRERDNLLRSVLSSLSAHIAVVDSEGVILAVNRAWQEFAKKNRGSQLAREDVGMNYLDVCRAAAGAPDAARALAGIQAVLWGGMQEFVMEYGCHAPAQKRWFLFYATPLTSGRCGAVLSHVDITQRKLAELEREELARQLRSVERLASLGELVQRVVTEHSSSAAASARGEGRSAAPVVALDNLLRNYERLLDAASQADAPAALVTQAESARAEVNQQVVQNLCQLLLQLTEFARGGAPVVLPRSAPEDPSAPLVAALQETIGVLKQTQRAFKSRSLGQLRGKLEQLLDTRPD